MSDAATFRSHVQTVEDLRGPAGRLEAVLNTGRADAPYAVLVAHPHPLGGGTMHNKVVYHAAKAFSSLRAAMDWLAARYAAPLLFAGFSFGSYVGLRACCGDARIRGLAGIGLPVRAAGRDYKYEFLPGCSDVPKLFVCGDHDEFSPRDVLEAVLVAAAEPKRIVWVEGADHFFAGTAQSPASKLDVLSGAIRTWLADEFAL
jgi:alpha/beta superfamily hydrolase